MSKKLIRNSKIKTSKPKVLVVLGPTASGKTDLGIFLARKFNGEIISADSRQVYKGLDVGSGKDLIKYSQGGKKVKYHLIDIVNPQTKFNLAKYQKKAFQALEKIIEKKKLPIIVGGSGLYLQAVVDNYNLLNIKSKLSIKNKNEKLGVENLLKKINKLKPNFAQHLNNSDRHNARRLARYLEIIESGYSPQRIKKESPYQFLIIGLNWSRDILQERILQRILERLEKEGMIAEVKKLHDQGLSWKRLKSFGLEYKFIAAHLLGELSYSEMIDKLSKASYRFAKRQETWFKRWEKQGKKIEWLNDYKEIEKKLKSFLKT